MFGEVLLERLQLQQAQRRKVEEKLYGHSSILDEKGFEVRAPVWCPCVVWACVRVICVVSLFVPPARRKYGCSSSI